MLSTVEDVARDTQVVCAHRADVVGGWETLIPVIIELIQNWIESCNEDEEDFVENCGQAENHRRLWRMRIRRKLRKQVDGVANRIIAADTIADSLVDVAAESRPDERRAVYAHAMAG